MSLLGPSSLRVRSAHALGPDPSHAATVRKRCLLVASSSSSDPSTSLLVDLLASPLSRRHDLMAYAMRPTSPAPTGSEPSRTLRNRIATVGWRIAHLGAAIRRNRIDTVLVLASDYGAFWESESSGHNGNIAHNVFPSVDGLSIISLLQT